jgi:urea transporter
VAGEPPTAIGFVMALAHGIGQVRFQASIWTALLFLVGIAINDWEHALWVVVASGIGMLVGRYHHDSAEVVAGLGLTATTQRWPPSRSSCRGGR